jgi:hypothetical protein
VENSEKGNWEKYYTEELTHQVKLSRYMPWWHIGGEEVQLLLILYLGTRGEWVVSVTPRPRFTLPKRTPGNRWIGGWVGLRAGMDAGVRIKILCPCRGSNPDRPARSQTLYSLSYPGSFLLFFAKGLSKWHNLWYNVRWTCLLKKQSCFTCDSS